MSISCLSTASFNQNVGDGLSRKTGLYGRHLNLEPEAGGPSVMKTGSFGATIHFSRVSSAGGGREGRGVAVKKYWVDAIQSEGHGEDLVRYISHEVSTMNMLKHPNILPCIASMVVNQEIWLVTPLCEFGSVTSLLGSGFSDGLPEMVCCFIIRDILHALQYLHHQGVVHRSVRCSHILISGKGDAVLSGFRYSTSLHSTGEHRSNLYDYPLHAITSNMFWLAPEILKQNLLGYSETSDVYSLGVSCCEMANGVVPYSDFPSTLMLIEKLRGSSPRLLDFSTLSAAAQQENEDGGEDEENGGTEGHQPPVDGAVVSAGGAGGGGAQPPPLTDSGVGESVGGGSSSTANMLGKNSTFYNREFSAHFHDFVAECTISCGEERPGTAALLQHPWIKQLRKTTVTLTTLLHSSVKPVSVVHQAGQSSDNKDNTEARQDDDDCGLVHERMQGLKLETPDTNIGPWDF